MSQQDAGTDATKVIRALRALENDASEDVAELLRAVLEDVASSRLDTGASDWAARSSDGVTRTSRGISVSSKELVMQVFLDAAENYSVSGYAQRARECFGEIYLALDKGAEYDRQSTDVNKAIGRITAAEAFDVALRETRIVLAANPAAGIQEVSDKVLAALCRHWFDLPDAVNVVEGGLRLDTSPPPRCPGDFSTPSGYIFKPDPGIFLGILARAHGGMLKQAILNFVAEHKASGAGPHGALSRAIFDAFGRGEDDLIARTTIGVMMGMLPTVDGNVTRTVNAWKADATFAALQQALSQHAGTNAFIRARDVLETPLKQAMQFAPVPDAVWRTAVRAHTLGTTNPVQVNPGDKIYVGIVGATREDLQAGITDVFPVFGGDRSATPHPTHACPGYEMAMGVLLGIINGVMEPT